MTDSSNAKPSNRTVVPAHPLEAVFHQNRSRLLALATRMTSSSEAEDVVQDAMLCAFKNWGSFRGQAAPATWLYRVTMNAALMRLRTKRRKAAVSLDAFPRDIQEQMVNADPRVLEPASALALLQKEEARALVDAAKRKLPQLDRRLLDMRLSDDLDVADAAARLGVSTTAAKTRLFRARNAMRRTLLESPLPV